MNTRKENLSLLEKTNLRNPKLDKSSKGDKLLWTSGPAPSRQFLGSLPKLPLDFLPGNGLLETEEQALMGHFISKRFSNGTWDVNHSRLRALYSSAGVKLRHTEDKCFSQGLE